MSDKDSVGAGTAFLMMASLVNVVSNYVIHMGLARGLGPKMYGIFGVVISLFIINRGFLGAGITKAASKYLAESRDNIAAITRLAIKLQLCVAVILASTFIIFSGRIAAMLRDASLAPYIVLVGIITIPLSLLFFYLEGYLNGLRQFKSEAIGNILHSSLRVLFVLMFVLLGLEIYGALLGDLVAIIATLAIAVMWFGIRLEKDGFFSKKKMILFAAPLLVTSLTWIFVRNINVLLIKSILADDVAAGFYTAAAALADVPYIMFAALSATILPVISEAVSSKNIELARKYIIESMRYMLMGFLPITAITSATATNLVTLLYSSQYAAAGEALNILIFGTMFLLILLVLISIISGSGKPKVSMIVSTGTLTMVIIGSLLLIPKYGITGAAISFTAASFLSMVTGIIYTSYKFGKFVKLFSLARMLFVSGIIFIIAYLVPVSGILLLGAYAFLLCLYFFLLGLIGEIKKQDIDFVKKTARMLSFHHISKKPK